MSETLLCERGIPADLDSGNETHTLGVEGWQERTRSGLMFIRRMGLIGGEWTVRDNSSTLTAQIPTVKAPMLARNTRIGTGNPGAGKHRGGRHGSISAEM